MSLIKEINGLKNTKISKVINARLCEFDKLNSKSNEDWFSELCFCILTANSRAITAIKIQQEIGCGFLNYSENKISNIIKKNKHRFHNLKAKYIVEARNYWKIKDILVNITNKRDWIVDNIKGIGYKEASHFLRNVGFKDYAILDRHILRVLKENNYIKEIPLLNKTNYIHIENKLYQIASDLDMSQAELDLYLWYFKTGNVLK